jgi:Raf kinase inhibitor-like YbhB/YbcL family protein
MRLFSLFITVCVIAVMSAFVTDNNLSVTSSVFANNGMIPVKYTCLGQQASPPITVKNVPAGTKSLALIVHDPDAPMKGGFTHWLVWNIEPATTTIAENFRNDFEGLNSAKEKGYKAMCPPTGTHHYHFTVYALDVLLNIDKGTTTKASLEKIMQGHILASGDLVGTYDKSYR